MAIAATFRPLFFLASILPELVPSIRTIISSLIRAAAHPGTPPCSHWWPHSSGFKALFNFSPRDRRDFQLCNV